MKSIATHELWMKVGLGVKQSPNAQNVFWPIPGHISCTRVTRSVGITHRARVTDARPSCVQMSE